MTVFAEKYNDFCRKIIKNFEKKYTSSHRGSNIGPQEHTTSGSDQKANFDHDRLIRLQKSIFRSDHRFSILHDRSFHLPVIDFSIFFLTMKKDPIS